MPSRQLTREWPYSLRHPILWVLTGEITDQWRLGVDKMRRLIYFINHIPLRFPIDPYSRPIYDHVGV